MTHKQKACKQDHHSMVASALMLFTLFASVFLSDTITESVQMGLHICVSSVIGAVFPFMILSSLLIFFSDFERKTWAGRLFARIFHLPQAGLCALYVGMFCGYPLGVKATVDLYRSGQIDREDAERLMGFTNNTGPAFLCSAVGLGMRDSIKDGILLYACMVVSAIAVGMLFAIGKPRKKETATCTAKAAFSLSDCIKEAGVGTLTVCAFLTFFSVICGLLLSVEYLRPYLPAVLPFLEVSCAASLLAKAQIAPFLSLCLTSFAVSFSGISVHLQAKALLSGTDLSMKTYYKMKLLQGVLSALLCVIFTSIVNYR